MAPHGRGDGHLTEQAGDLVDAVTVDTEADTISTYFQAADGDGG